MKTILSIRFQTCPFWIIKPDGTSTHLDVTNDDLDNPNLPEGVSDFETWIKENRDKYGITHIKDENWIEFEMNDLYEATMPVDDYLDYPGYSF